MVNINKTNRLLLLYTSIVMLVLVACTVLATPPKKFSGVWVLKTKNFISGPEYADALPEKLIVVETGDSIFLKKINYANEDSTVMSEHFALHAKIAIVKTKGGRAKSTRVNRVDPGNLSIESSLSFPNHEKEVEYTIHEFWSLKGDRQLHIRKTSIDSYGNMHTFSVMGEYIRE